MYLLKQKFVFFAFVLAIFAIPYNAIAEYDFSAVAPTGQTLYYTIVNSNEVSVTHPSSNYFQPYNGFSVPIGELSLPSTVTNGGTTYSVTSIEDYAFANCSGLTSLTIPNSVTSIGRFTFYNCSSLTSLTIPNSVTSIGTAAFSGCSNLTSLIIPNSVTSIEDYAFDTCSGLTSIEVSNGNIIYDSRENCNAIIETASNTLICGCASSTIPNSVTSIGTGAFYGYSNLTSLIIPNSVTSIGTHAFFGCSNLTSLIIPNSVTLIGEEAFAGCSGLTSIIVSSGNTVYDNRENCNAIIETASNTLIFGCANTTVPNSVTSIGDNAFYGCSGLTSLTIPNSVTSIGDHAFRQCSGLTSLTIGNSVTSIGDFAFILCTSLTSLTIPNSVISIGQGVFQDCSSLTSLTIGNSVTSIGGLAFYRCSGLTEINCLRATAPTLLVYPFNGVDHTIPVNIPCGSLASYQSEWSYFSNFNEVFSPYTLDVHSSDDAMGSASITNLPNCDDNTAVIEATAHAGYIFDHWSDGATANPYTLQLTDNTTLIAYFAVNVGIEDLDDSGIRVYAKNHQIHIDAAIGEAVNVYTLDGRTIAALPKATEHIAIPVTTAGVYLVRIGNHPARKVVVIW